MSFRTVLGGVLLLAIIMAPAVARAATVDREGRDHGRRTYSPGARADPWQQLRPRMTRDDVRAILGAPPWTDRLLRFEFWMYEVPSALATGVVVFEEGRVFSWRFPAGPAPSLD